MLGAPKDINHVFGKLVSMLKYSMKMIGMTVKNKITAVARALLVLLITTRTSRSGAV
jgi:hypothetical protein